MAQASRTKEHFLVVVNVADDVTDAMSSLHEKGEAPQKALIERSWFFLLVLLPACPQGRSGFCNLRKFVFEGLYPSMEPTHKLLLNMCSNLISVFNTLNTPNQFMTALPKGFSTFSCSKSRNCSLRGRYLIRTGSNNQILAIINHQNFFTHYFFIAFRTKSVNSAR